MYGVPQPDNQRGYPRPQLVREPWTSLNGPWDFALDADGDISDVNAIEWTRTIEVPFAPETAASGIADTGLFRATWYRRRFNAPAGTGLSLLLHFGAVDFRALRANGPKSVWA